MAALPNPIENQGVELLELLANLLFEATPPVLELGLHALEFFGDVIGELLSWLWDNRKRK